MSDLIARVLDAREAVHREHSRDGSPAPCVVCPSAVVLGRAIAHLDAKPRDARGAQRILHDALCMSEGCSGGDHAARTQTRTVAALRRWHGAA